MATKAKPRLEPSASEDPRAYRGVQSIQEAAAEEAAAAVPDAAAPSIVVEARDALTDVVMPRLIPLGKLKAGTDNVRRGGKADVEQLAADIAAHGVLQNLVAIEAGPADTFEVVAGGRRLKALELLKRQGKIDGDYLVPVQIVDAEAARELSLAENFQRIAMNPAEEAEAFAKLAQEGAATADIAARFGLTELHVKQRLRLAGLHPDVLKALKAGKITLDVAKAFASVPDQARQWDVLKNTGSWLLGSPDAVRREMAKTGLPSDHFICSYVGEDVYLAAGGAIAADLFSTASTRLWVDGALAQRLAEEKLGVDAKLMAAEAGIGGVVSACYHGGTWRQRKELVPYQTATPLIELPADVRAGLMGAVELVGAEDGYAIELSARAWLLDASVPVDPPATDEPDEDEPEDPAPPPPAEPEDDGKLKPLPQALRDALAMRKRDALALALLQDTRAARDVALFMLCELALKHERAELGTALAIPYPGVNDPVRDLPMDHLSITLAEWADFGPSIRDDESVRIDDSWRHLKTSADRFAAFIELPGEERAHWAALALGRTLTAHGARELRDAIAASLGLTGVHPGLWRPTAENYFDRAGKARCLAFLEDVLGGPDAVKPFGKLKKDVLSKTCEQIAAGELRPAQDAKLLPLEATDIVDRCKAWMPAELTFGVRSEAARSPDAARADHRGDCQPDDVDWAKRRCLALEEDRPVFGLTPDEAAELDALRNALAEAGHG